MNELNIIWSQLYEKDSKLASAVDLKAQLDQKEKII